MAEREEVIVDLEMNESEIDKSIKNLYRSIQNLEKKTQASVDSLSKFPDLQNRIKKQVSEIKDRYVSLNQEYKQGNISLEEKRQLLSKEKIAFEQIKTSVKGINSLTTQAKNLDKERIQDITKIAKQTSEARREAERMVASYKELGSKANLQKVEAQLESIKKQELEIQKLRTSGVDLTSKDSTKKLQALSEATDKTKESIADLGVELEKDTTKAPNQIANITKRAIAYTGLFSVIAGGIAIIQAIIQNTLEYDAQVYKLSVILDVSRNKAEKLTATLSKLSQTYGENLEDVNKVALELGRAGVAYDDLAKSSETVIKLALLTGDSIDQASSAVVTYLQVFGKDRFGNAIRTVDELGAKLAFLANASKLSTEEINVLSSYALSSSKSIGLTIDAVNGLAVSLSNSGKSSSSVGTLIRRFTTLINDQGDAVTSFFDKINVNQKNLARNLAQGGQESNKALIGFLDQISKYSKESYNEALSGVEILGRDTLQSLQNSSNDIIKQITKSINVSSNEINKAKEITESYTKTFAKLRETSLAVAEKAFNPLIGVTAELAKTFSQSNTSLLEFLNTLEKTDRQLVSNFNNTLDETLTKFNELFSESSTKKDLANFQRGIYQLSEELKRLKENVDDTSALRTLEVIEKKYTKIVKSLKDSGQEDLLNKLFEAKEAKKELETLEKQIQAMSNAITNSDSPEAIEGLTQGIVKLASKYDTLISKVNEFEKSATVAVDNLKKIYNTFTDRDLINLQTELTNINKIMLLASKEGANTFLKVLDSRLDGLTNVKLPELRKQLSDTFAGTSLSTEVQDLTFQNAGDFIVKLTQKSEVLRDSISKANKEDKVALANQKELIDASIQSISRIVTGRAKILGSQQTANNELIRNKALQDEIRLLQEAQQKGEVSSLALLKVKIQSQKEIVNNLKKQSNTLSNDNKLLLEQKKLEELNIQFKSKSLSLSSARNEKNQRLKEQLEAQLESNKLLLMTESEKITYLAEEISKRRESAKTTKDKIELAKLENKLTKLSLKYNSDYLKVQDKSAEAQEKKLENGAKEVENAEKLLQKEKERLGLIKADRNADITSARKSIQDKLSSGDILPQDAERINSVLNDLEKVRNKYTGISEAVAIYNAKIKTGDDLLKDIADNTLQNLEDGMVDFLDLSSDKFLRFGDLAKNVLNDIYRQLLRQQIIQPLVSVVGGAVGGVFKGGTSITPKKDGGYLPTQKFAQGGMLTGGSGRRDDLYLGSASGSHVFAMGGEFFTKQQSVNPETRPTLEYINKTGKTPNQSVVVNTPVKIEIENKSGTPIEATNIEEMLKTNQKGEKEKVIRIVMEAMQTDSGFRSIMKGSM